MKIKFTNRQTIIYSIILFYFLPIALLSFYSLYTLPRTKSWLTITLGLLILSFGAILFTILLNRWEKTFKRQALDPRHLHKVEKTPPPNIFKIIENEEKINECNALKVKVEELEEKQSRFIEENNILLTRVNHISQEYADYKIFSEEQLKQKNLQLQNFQRNIEDQQGEYKHQQEYMEKLHTKVKDLSYEIKTLLSINEREKISQETLSEAYSPDKIENDDPVVIPVEKQVHNEIDASLLLKRCINMAQKLTGAFYYGNELSRYREFTPSHSAIDLRRLYDSLRIENEALIIVYSPKDQKLLFANNQSRAFLGWSSDKFVVDFSTLIKEGSADWKKAVNSISFQTEALVKLLLKSKSGQDIYFNCHLGSIPTGLFRGYVIGVLYTPSAVTSEKSS